MAKSKTAEGSVQQAEGSMHQAVDSSVVYDLSSLWKMKFRDPITGELCMVRKAFKPRGKLELYRPEE